MGGAVGLMIYSSDERVLRNASGEIELLAKRARTIAILQQTPYALEFREGVVRLLPLAQAGRDEKKRRCNRIAANRVRPKAARAGRSISMAAWNFPSAAGTPTNGCTTKKNAVHVWRFDPDGLCEPISVRLTLDKSWAEDTYHPLTATIRESQLEAR